ncbi:MAG: threonine synthase, partial [Ferruginibacter sp.]
VFKKNNYILDPHGAVGYNALQKIKTPGEAGIFLETASPAKFRESVEPVIGQQIPLPASLEKFEDREVKSVKMENDYEALKNFLRDK